ncbi:TRAP transporter substrate-binding protein [Vibrio aestuarianus]|uniref:TRAP transporter substrate-binding protein n=1 Tax=Vibrio aestuarianus TaxID=28171 RepID=UPI001446111B|nr:TRAP transporter substrate-binding protein [Vibrio aestuarianus]MDE1214486.1 TRAP transporter substrate-binding protein [Vibrio aestuarianus]MDE1217326.1 TRAP transporter substrate-binding protein [Vibrio aestuarianus]MDE1261436.1 TRAP transporter substrate-binding protein [Vibrio aestuarianus]MDE1268457.1 TRAP transporter substrate-binding protein [Vibrio aestuarianus]MDE1275818.1 TRAP transporter substrate-binding protein [Vibrio aestuarianus]
MLKPLTLLSASILAVTSLNAAANCDPGEMVIKFSHVTNTDKHPKGIAASLLEERVNKEMNGKACMQVFPNSTLYDYDKVLEALLNGDVQLAAPSLSKFEKFTKKFRIFDLPFLFDDVDAVDRFQNSADGEKLKNSMARRGVKGLEFWHNGMKQMSANKPLLVPGDAKGLKFRVQASDVLVAQFEQLGANPQKMSFAEVYGGLQTKVIDGQENTWSNTYGKKFFEVQDGITETNHGILDYLVVTSTKWWDGLPTDIRDQFATILKEVTETRNSESNRVEQQNRQYVLEAGGVIRTLTPEQRQEWVTALKPVWKKFEKDIGTDLIDAALASNQ